MNLNFLWLALVSLLLVHSLYDSELSYVIVIACAQVDLSLIPAHLQFSQLHNLSNQLVQYP